MISGLKYSIKYKLLMVAVKLIALQISVWSLPEKLTYSQSVDITMIIKKADNATLKGKYWEALILLENIKKENARINDYYEISFRKGRLNWITGNPAKAYECYLEAKKSSEYLRDVEKNSLSNACMDIIQMYSKAKKLRGMCKYNESIALFKKAIMASREIVSPEFEMKCQRQMSLVFNDINELAKFLECNEIALSIARILHHRQDQGYCLNNIGVYYYKTDQYSKAIGFFKDSLQIAREENYLKVESECITNLGIIYSEIGENDMALECYMKSLEIDRKINNTEYIAMDMNSIATYYRNKWNENGCRQDLLTAYTYMINCYKLLKENMSDSFYIKVLNNLGNVSYNLNNINASIQYYRDALKKAEMISDKEAICSILGNIGIVKCSSGKDEEALEYYQKAIAIAAEIDNSQILWNTLCEMADLKKKKGDFDEALKCYEYAMNVIEKSRSSIGDEDLKALYLGSNRRLAAFHGAIDLLYKISRNGDASGAAARAFGYIERAKARGFMDSLEIGRVSAAQPVDPVTDNKMKALQIRLSRLSRQLGEPPPSYEESRVAEEEALRLEEEYEKFRRDLRLLDPRFAGVRFPDLITLEQLKSSLPDDGTVVLTYALGQESAYGLAIDRKGQRLFPLPAPRVLRELVVRHLKWVSDPERKPEETAVDLYRTLIAPGIKETCPRILIVPDDVLHYLPFETIRPPAGSHWLGAETEIAYAPSLSSLAEIEKRADQRRPPHLDFFAVAAADPEVAEDQGSFRYRSEEVDEISKLFRPGRCVLLKGEEAGEANLKRSPLSDARIIHFAAHGTIDEQKPVRSAIILGDEPGSDEDGRFQAREVYDLRLNAGLVVLSSCRSAAGKLLRGEGIIGLSRAFLFAGASAVLMSLWPVDEEATRHLMGRFYFHLKDGHTASASLRLAKTEMIDSTHFSHPYFWAGFVVAGAANRRLTPGFSSWRAATLGAAFLIGAAVFLAIRRNRKNKY